MSSDNFKMCTWWIHAYRDNTFVKQNRVIVKMLLSVNIYLEEICKCCEMNVVNDAVHILFVCPCNSELRNMLWNEVKNSSPSVLFSNMERMSFREKTRFVLNACDSYYVHEWKSMFDALSNYICKASKCYFGVYNAM